MGIYIYKDKKSDLVVEVIRHYKDYEQVPTDEELPAEERGKERDWERRIGKLAFVQKWPSTSGSVKGRA